MLEAVSWHDLTLLTSYIWSMVRENNCCLEGCFLGEDTQLQAGAAGPLLFHSHHANLALETKELESSGNSSVNRFESWFGFP